MPLPHQDKVCKFYDGSNVQICVAVLIGANFLTNIVEKEIDAHGDKYKDAFGAFELLYNILFTIELAFNLYSHWFRQFWRSNWNIFDVVVVTIGIVNTLQLPLPESFRMLRMMRAFRVFRLFKRVHSLNKIVVCIVHAVPGVMNAFLILAIVMSIYAILAVEFYYEIGENCSVQGDVNAWLLTPRGHCAGQEYFGTFTKSLYSFFQVLTGESWSEFVARPAMWYFHDDALRAVGGGFFFVTYVLITAFVLTNVVVAVLLDKMVDPAVEDAVVTAIEDDAVGAEGKGEAGESGDKNGESQNGTVGTDPVDLPSAISSVTNQVDELMANSQRMSSELDSFRRDMASMRDQVSDVMKFIPGLPGIAASH